MGSPVTFNKFLSCLSNPQPVSVDGRPQTLVDSPPQAQMRTLPQVARVCLDAPPVPLVKKLGCCDQLSPANYQVRPRARLMRVAQPPQPERGKQTDPGFKSQFHGLPCVIMGPPHTCPSLSLLVTTPQWSCFRGFKEVRGGKPLAPCLAHCRHWI